MRFRMGAAETVGYLVGLKRTVAVITGGMRFQVVMAKAIGDLMSVPRTVALVAGGIAPTVIFSLVWRETFQAGTMSLDMETGLLVGFFIIISLLWTAGIYLIYMVVGISGLELVDREREQGTLLLMVSKPISRSQFLLGKFLALVLTTLLLEAIILLGSVLMLWGLLGLDPDIVAALMQLLPWIFLFSLLVTLVFASISVAVSTLVGSYLVRNIVLMGILVLAFAVGPVLRVQPWWPNVYEDYRLYYVDGSYNLGNAYVPLLDQAETGRMQPVFQAWLGITTGTYKAGAEVLLAALLGGETFDPDIGAMPSSLERTTYLPPAVSIGLFLAVAAAAFGVANLALNRKEVQ